MRLSSEVEEEDDGGGEKGGEGNHDKEPFHHSIDGAGAIDAKKACDDRRENEKREDEKERENSNEGKEEVREDVIFPTSDEDLSNEVTVKPF